MGIGYERITINNYRVIQLCKMVILNMIICEEVYYLWKSEK